MGIRCTDEPQVFFIFIGLVKPLQIMARIEIRFKDVSLEDSFLRCEPAKHGSESNREDVIAVDSYENGELTCSIYLDKSTAIKFAKTLRTEINKIKD